MRSTGVLGTCKRCPCSENAYGCELDHENRVICLCNRGYDGDQCNYSGMLT